MPCCCWYLVTKLCLNLCNPKDCSPPSSSVHGILQARILEWITIFCSRGSYWPQAQTCISCIGRQILYHWATRKAHTNAWQFVTAQEIQTRIYYYNADWECSAPILLLWSSPRGNIELWGSDSPSTNCITEESGLFEEKTSLEGRVYIPAGTVELRPKT